MKRMAGRKRHSAEDIVRKLCRADEMTAAGKTGEEIAAELEVSPATLYNWRRAYGGIDTDAAKEHKELREQNARLKRLLTKGELVKDALRTVAPTSPACPPNVRFYSDMTIAYPKGVPPWIKPGTNGSPGTDFVTVDGMPAVHFSGLTPTCAPL